jgi:hypothetical protein
MVYWTTVDDVPPSRSPKNVAGDFPATPFAVDATHVYYPRNTEYEIFTTSKRQHTLGALLAVNHRTVLDLPALPIRRVAERAHAEGALLDLDKHNWEWSMALVPICKPDLYELANNHHWRTEFGITNWAVPAPAWMNIGNGSSNERDWASYGFQNYYALLNCGFRLRPCAGTAHGVHPVPLGFGRVYVHLDGPFRYESWMQGLGAGRSFVTTGPMLLATFDGADPGHRFERSAARAQSVTLKGRVRSEAPVTQIEIIVNGELSRTVPLEPKRTAEGAFEAVFDHRESLAGSSWVALRCWEERGQDRVRFAHTAPVYYDLPGSQIRPRRVEVDFLAGRVRQEIERSKTLLPREALAEYEEALAFYEGLKRNAR